MSPVKQAFMEMYAAFEAGDRLRVCDALDGVMLVSGYLLPFPREDETMAVQMFILDVLDVKNEVLGQRMSVTDAHMLMKAKVDSLVAMACDSGVVLPSMMRVPPKKMGSV